MRTSALIDLLAVDTSPARPLTLVLISTLAVLMLVVGAVALGLLGLNPDLGGLLRPSRMLLRQVLPALLVSGGVMLLLRLSRPGDTRGSGGIVLAIALVLAFAVTTREMSILPEGEWRPALFGATARFCFLAIVLIGLPFLAGTLWVLRRGATLKPTLAGALAGAVAGALSAAIYALHCNETSALFYVAWYGLGIAALTGLGALLGTRCLRW